MRMTRPLTNCDVSDRNVMQRPQPDGRSRGHNEKNAIQDIKHDFHAGDEPKRSLPLLHLLRQRFACVSVLPLRMGEELHRHDIRIAVDDPADEHRACFRRFSRAFLDARHKITKRGYVSDEPDHQRNGQPPIRRRKQQCRADELHTRVPERIDELNHALAQRRPCLHDLVGDAARKIVLKEPEALAQDIAVRLPANARRASGRQHLIFDEIVRRRNERPEDQRDERHQGQHRGVRRNERRRISVRPHPVDDRADEAHQSNFDRRAKTARDQQQQEERPKRLDEKPIERPQPIRRPHDCALVERLDAGLSPAHEAAKHGIIASKKTAHAPKSADPTGDSDRWLIVDAG